MYRILIFLLIFFRVSSVWAITVGAGTTIGGDRSHQLVGYGFVTGLSGQGDGTLKYTTQTFSNMLKRFGLNIPIADIKSDNVAAVMVTAELKPFAKEGSKVDVVVSSIGDAKTLQGGILLQTPLLGADDQVYVVAQGPVVVGGFFAGAEGEGGAIIQQNHPTVGMIANGGIIERTVKTDILENGSVNLFLINPDFTSAVRLADAINRTFPGTSMAKDSTSVNVQIPQEYRQQPTNFIAQIEKIEFTPETKAKVIINERTGTIVATKDVRISTVAISHGSLTVNIAQDENVSQPNAFSETGTTAVTQSTDTVVEEKRGRFKVINNFPTIERLTAALNTLGVSTRDMISIFQSLKSAGALQAELIVN